ncbi:ATP-binding protein [Pseudohoeflea coraliihabitans]|uniref:histidine kinase n=1 Tax=Pseudohoeflea coraliihabitans TaxID=2860393 RepID=A0ABS6WR29_9HYPH|nr:ATP-binding protein [Pseudohoeflea sp. DP4N28-3]MBW3097499.1 hypothetical protein [Pseudohoeflea sp. DP4N28-3]
MPDSFDGPLVARQAFSFLAALDTPVIVIDSETAVIFANAAAEEHLGAYPANALLSARIRSPQILDMVDRVIADGEARTMEHAERVPAERWFEIRVATVPPEPVPEAADRTEKGLQNRGKTSTSPGPETVKYFILSFRDLTEARRMDRMRTDFVANASHELRTPLASLMGFVETMQGPARGDLKAQERFLAIMLEQASRMARLIDDLLSLSRLEMRAHVPLRDTVDLGEVALHVVDALRPMAAEIGVEIALAGPDGDATVIGDRDELIQVLENLVENACKYGQSGGRVDVRIVAGGAGSSSGSTGPLVEVQDYGPGIERQHVPRLTERFYRADVGESRAKKGTGLGLAIVKHILTRHRARLIVRSEPGEGSTFAVRFPDANADTRPDAR